MADTLTTAPGAPAATLTLETASQAGNLDDLARLAQSMEGAAAAAPGGTATGTLTDQVQRQTNAELIAGALITGREGFCVFTSMQSPRATMSDAKCREVAGLWGAWCDRRQIDLNTLSKGHADTIMAAGATIMLALAVYQAASLELATRKPVEAKPATAAPPSPEAASGSNVAIFPGTPGPRVDE